MSAVTAELIADGLIAEVGRKASTSAGKPATLLGVEPDARHVVALDLSDDDVIEAAVVNLAGKIVARHSQARNGETGKKAAAAIVRLARDIARGLDRPASRRRLRDSWHRRRSRCRAHCRPREVDATNRWPPS